MYANQKKRDPNSNCHRPNKTFNYYKRIVIVLSTVLTAFPKVYDPQTATDVLISTTKVVVVGEDSLSCTPPWSLLLDLSLVSSFCLRSSDPVVVVGSSSMLSTTFTFSRERERERVRDKFDDRLTKCSFLKMLKSGWGKGKMYQTYLISIWAINNDLHWQVRLGDERTFWPSNSFPVNLM